MLFVVVKNASKHVTRQLGSQNGWRLGGGTRECHQMIETAAATFFF